MRYPYLIALAAPWLVSLSAQAAEWPAGERDHFVKECMAGAQAQVGADKLQKYCGCAADRVSAEFSQAELDELKAQKTPLPKTTHERLLSVTNKCLTQLN
ncbi:hypothetical protein [Pseudomonas tohonis]|uniref:hypothetical protein n=1 Tax=Pseudomonas tohonis TaxID=2725477 RepID=UPI00255BD9EA|nr:hypothetical protein [Pseudomonas tohonis]